MERIKIGFTREVACVRDGSQSMYGTGHAKIEEMVFHTQRISSTNNLGYENIKRI